MRLIFIVVMLLFLSQNLLSLPTEGLISHYEANGNGNDESGNSNNVTLSGAGFTSDRFGNTNSAFSFSPSADKVTSLSEDNANFNLTTFTVAAWFRVDETASTQAIITHGESFDTDKIQYGLLVQGGRVEAWFEASDDADHQLFSTTNVVSNEWTFAAVTRSSSGDYSLYVNGVEEASSAGTPSPASINHFVSIGYRTNSGNVEQDFLTGAIDSVFVYDDALSSLEVAELFNDPNPNATIPEPSSLLLFFLGGVVLTRRLVQPKIL